MSIKILVVDDTVIFRRIVSDALAGIPGVEVVGTAANGKLALSRLAALKPDLVTLDIEMPEKNGIEVLESLRATGFDTEVVVLSAHTVHGGELTVRALELGAFDFITKPESGTPQENTKLLRDRFLSILQVVERKRRSHPSGAPERAKAAPALRPPSSPAAPRPQSLAARPLVLIGVSTGGPVALSSLLPCLPEGLEAPVFIVQHMPPLFTQALATSLAAKSSLRVKEAADGEIAEDGCAYLAPGGKHMKVARGPRGEIVIRISDDPPENNCKPAVDYLFRSAALHFPGRSVAAILTGMGDDGTAGLRMLKRSGCFAIAQDEASCVVFGMPKEAIQAGVIDEVMPIESIAGAITRAVRGRRA